MSRFGSEVLVLRTDVRYRESDVLTSPSTPDRFDDLATPLCDVTFVVLDLETTGTSPDLDEITEVGAVKYRGGECLGSFDTLVNPGMPIPPFITILTGITEAMVLPAPRIDEVLPALLEFIGSAVIVGHNIRFDISFLDAALVRRGGCPAPESPGRHARDVRAGCCTTRSTISSSGTLARHLRVDVEPCHRAFADADATAEVFHALLERAGTFGVLALDDLIALPKVRLHPSTSKLRLTARIPRRPGVYRFRDRNGAVLYVGRATNLRTAVRAHFRGDRRRVPQLLCETEAIDWIECTDELEASVREARLVREHEPRFNRHGKGWRGYAYLKLTLNERFPRLAVVHTARDDGALYVGPLASFAAVTALRSAIEAAVPIRRCSTRISAERRRTRCRAVPGRGRPGRVPVPGPRLGGRVPDGRRHRRARAQVRARRAGRAARPRGCTTSRPRTSSKRRPAPATSGRRWPGCSTTIGCSAGCAPSGTLRFLTDSGVVELEHGRLALGDDGDARAGRVDRTRASSARARTSCSSSPAGSSARSPPDAPVCVEPTDACAAAGARTARAARR